MAKKQIMIKKIIRLTGALASRLVVVLWCAFVVILIGWVVVASFSTTPNIFKGTLFSGDFNIRGYLLVFKQYPLWRYFLNSILYTGFTCALLVLLCAPAAYALSNFEFRGKKIIHAALAGAMGLPGIMLLAPLFMALVSLKLSDNMVSLITIYVGIGIPFSMFYLLGFFSTIPKSMQEAALIEGCTHIKGFWRVVFPLAQPGIITVVIFNFISYWNEYIWALVLTNGNEKKTLSVALQSIVQGMGNTGDYVGLFAAVVIVFVPTFFLFVFLSDTITGSITAGAVKG